MGNVLFLRGRRRLHEFDHGVDGESLGGVQQELPSLESVTTRKGIPNRSSSQAVSREPWSSGRVSSTHTWDTLPASKPAVITPTAVP